MEKNENALSDWGIATAEESTTTLEQMDDLIIKLRAARDDYEAKKKTATEAHNEYERLESLVVNTLTANKRSKYAVEGVANVHIVVRESFTTPKSAEAKAALFQYIEEKAGREALLGMQSINSNTLNAWAKQESESGVMVIPGLEAPTATEKLSLTRK